MASTRVGAQQPRVRVEPKRAYTDGDNAAELSAAYGNTLDEWQQIVLDCWLGRDENGNLNLTEDMIRMAIINKRYTDQTSCCKGK